MRKWPKLTLVAHTTTHLIASASLTTGPSQDCPLFAAALRRATRHLAIDRLLADGGFDSEDNHRVAREDCRVRSTVINLNRRGKRAGSRRPSRPSPRKWARTRYRRQMYRRFHRRKYRQRWQVESVISRVKRRLGSALRGRSAPSRACESELRVFTHNLMILAGSSP